jgi:hypothetical protein
MKHIILTSHTAQGLNQKIENYLMDGWKPIGSHQVVETHHQLRYAGMQHKDTLIETEYSQSMQLEEVFVSLLDNLNS